jgi:pyrroloquinoline quinone (PQQ) biosynthesis protein C
MTEEDYLYELEKKLFPLQQQLAQHPLYSGINSMQDVIRFMEVHVYAVWDFMSLLKSLQNKLTCTTVPWYPKPYNELTYLVNEIVLGEESDTDENGFRKSHFELYLDAMRQCGIPTHHIQANVSSIALSGNTARVSVPEAVKDFVNYTIDLSLNGSTHAVAAAFTYGREDLIPEIFLPIVNQLDKSMPGKLSGFKYYLTRHIEVDGQHHSLLAKKMMKMLCGREHNLWQEARQVSATCLKNRIALWDYIHESIAQATPVKMNSSAYCN